MSTKDPLLGQFLDEYYEDTSYLDWGDDPSFFSAKHRLGDVREASWGVCRPDVRAALCPGDFVVFFCGRADLKAPKRWDYYYVGVGTVAQKLSREEIWKSPSFEPYRYFYNVLAQWTAGDLIQHETFYPYHDNWRERAASPYILFDRSSTAFNIRSPLHVATYSGAIPETWHLDSSPRVRELHQILFAGRADDRRLRTAHRGYGHVKLNLGGSTRGGTATRLLDQTSSALLDLVGVA